MNVKEYLEKIAKKVPLRDRAFNFITQKLLNDGSLSGVGLGATSATLYPIKSAKMLYAPSGRKNFRYVFPQGTPGELVAEVYAGDIGTRAAMGYGAYKGGKKLKKMLSKRNLEKRAFGVPLVRTQDLTPTALAGLKRMGVKNPDGLDVSELANQMNVDESALFKGGIPSYTSSKKVKKMLGKRKSLKKEAASMTPRKRVSWNADERKDLGSAKKYLRAGRTLGTIGNVGLLSSIPLSMVSKPGMLSRASGPLAAVGAVSSLAGMGLQMRGKSKARKAIQSLVDRNRKRPIEKTAGRSYRKKYNLLQP